MEEEEDLFENYQSLPEEVQAIIATYDNDDETFENCESLKTKLEAVGWTCDYGLDASPYGLRELEPQFMCGNCGGGFKREEMRFSDENDEDGCDADLCIDCAS